jgi:hypothetical protein
MPFYGDASQTRLLQAARQHLGLSYERLWIAYFGVGGNHPPPDIESWLTGDTRPSAHDYDLVASALNGQFADRGISSHPVAYSGTV